MSTVILVKNHQYQIMRVTIKFFSTDQIVELGSNVSFLIDDNNYDMHVHE